MRYTVYTPTKTYVMDGWNSASSSQQQQFMDHLRTSKYLSTKWIMWYDVKLTVHMQYNVSMHIHTDIHNRHAHLNSIITPTNLQSLAASEAVKMTSLRDSNNNLVNAMTVHLGRGITYIESHPSNIRIHLCKDSQGDHPKLTSHTQGCHIDNPVRCQ